MFKMFMMFLLGNLSLIMVVVSAILGNMFGLFLSIVAMSMFYITLWVDILLLIQDDYDPDPKSKEYIEERPKTHLKLVA